MIKSSRIKLRVWNEADLSALIALRNNITMQSQLLSRVRGSNVKQITNWLKERDNRLLFIIADCKNDAALGFIQITDIDSIDRRGVLGVCLIAEAQHHGLGTEAINLFLNYLSNIWNFRKINLYVRADNTCALKCYEKIGFVRCGLFKQHVFFEGRWFDVVIMEYFL